VRGRVVEARCVRSPGRGGLSLQPGQQVGDVVQQEVGHLVPGAVAHHDAQGGEILFAYIQLVGETPLDKLVALAARIGPEAKEVVVTTAEQLRAEGKTEGRAEGLAEGEARVLVRQLTRKFGAVPGAVRQRINTASLEQLETWCDRVLDAATLDEVFD
jgi:Domain of unknown function (DUF4351)